MTRPTAPHTVSVCFQEPPEHLHGDAWRILLHAVKGNELLPMHVRVYAKHTLAKSGTMPLTLALPVA